MAYTLSDVVELTGFTRSTLGRWCDIKAIIPAAGGTGHGNHRQFSLMQVVGMKVVIELRKFQRGCAVSYAADIVKCFGLMDEGQMLEKFEKGATHFLAAVGTQVVLENPMYGDMVNVQKVYQNLKKMEAQLKRKPVNYFGRNRGLVNTLKIGG